MKKLYLNIIWPGILIGLLIPFSGKLSHFQEITVEQPATPEAIIGPEENRSPSSTALLTETSESVCGELSFAPDSPQRMLQLPAFDPSKGTLTGVQITTVGTLIADISRKNLRHNDYHAMFSADLKCTLPSGLQYNHTTRLNYQASMSSEQQRKVGIQALVDETTTETKEITEALEQFYGTGHLDIPLEAVDLIDLKAENFNYRTQLDARVCIDYTYQSN